MKMVLGFLEKTTRKISGDGLKHDHRKGVSKPTDFGSEILTEPRETGVNIPTDPGKDVSEEAQEINNLKRRKSKGIEKATIPVVCLIVFSWMIGAIGVSWAWLFVGFGVCWSIVKTQIKNVINEAIRYEKNRLYRSRVLHLDETSEWLNLIINRWWVFSSGSIFQRLKKSLDPQLQDSKPPFVETIFLKEMTLGDRTPMFKSLRSWDSQGLGGREGSSFKTNCSHHTPSGLALAPTHAISILCDFILDSDAFSAVLGARVGHKGMGVDLDIGVEHLVLEGRVLVNAYLDMEAPFPHIARLTFSFIERPRLSFRVKILKSVQMMEMPVLKTWIYNLVTDALATAFVDPGQLEVNIHSSDAVIPEHRRGESLAKGVLTISLKLNRSNSYSNTSGDDDKWIVLVVEGTTHVTPPFKSSSWQDSCSFLLRHPPSSSNVVVKVKSKRLVTTTLTQFDVPLQNYNLESARSGEAILQKKCLKVMGGSVPSINMRMSYTPLTTLNLESPQLHQYSQSTEESGVLYIVIHGADNLPPSTSLSPYCLVFSNRKKIKTTHYIKGTISPRWECGVEILVKRLSSVCLTFLVCSLPRNPKLQDGELLGIQTLNLANNTLPMIQKNLPLNRDASSPVSEEVPTVTSTIAVSLIFRGVPSVSDKCSSLDSPSLLGKPVPNASSNSNTTTSTNTNFPNIGISLTASPLSTPIMQTRRGSTGIILEDGRQKKKNNATWLNQAKTFLGSHSDSSTARQQDLEDILSSGLGLLELTILRARDLVSKDLNGFSDPYCILKVNGEIKYRTQVKKKTLHPEWNESLMTHLPKEGQNFSLTLWDHDAFGMKDFLGSVSLSEDQVRRLSATGSPDWFKLEGTKRGCLEIKIKLISEDHQFGSCSRSYARRFRRCSETIISSSHESLTDSDESSACDGSNSNSLKREKVRKWSKTKRNNHRDNLRIKSSSFTSLLTSDVEKETRMLPTHLQPYCTPSRRRKSGAEILQSVLKNNDKAPRRLSLQREKTIVGIQVDRIVGLSAKDDNETSFLMKTEESCPNILKSDLPKISLNDPSDDEYELSAESSQECDIYTQEKTGQKITTEKLRKSVKEKVQPLRRFRSEANVTEFSSTNPSNQLMCSSMSSLTHGHRPFDNARSVNKTASIAEIPQTACGGGEGDASELLSTHNTKSNHHTQSYNHLSWLGNHYPITVSTLPKKMKLNGVAQRNPMSTNSMTKSATTFPLSNEKQYYNVRGVLRKVCGIPMATKCKQIFLRIQLREERPECLPVLKTISRSGFVPVGSSVTFECEWESPKALSTSSILVFEIRATSKDLLISVSLSINDLLQDVPDKGFVENWFDFEGGLSILLRVEHGHEWNSIKTNLPFKYWTLDRTRKK